MANPKHVEWLQEGVDAWNKRRELEPFDPDLGSVKFSDVLKHFKKPGEAINLNRINLEAANLRRADLSHLHLRNSILALADLQEADLSCAALEYARCFQANFTDANLYGVKLDHAEFYDAKLTNANLGCCDLQGVDFRDADLVGSNLTASEFWKATIFSGKKPEPSFKDDADNSMKEVSSISRFLEIFRTIKDSHTSLSQDLPSEEEHFTFDVEEEPVFYFRGHQQQSWQLCPSVMRNDNLREAEGDMLLDIMTQQPNAFQGLDSALAEWVLAQHHGLKTRLLDVTRNPLVALFCACSDEDGNKSDNVDANVHIFAIQKPLVKTFSSDTISVIANFAKLNQGEKGTLLSRTGQGDFTSFEYLEIMERLYHLIRHEKPYFHERIDPRDFFKVFIVEPQQSFDRIRIQSGAFLISGFHERLEREEILKLNPDTPVYDHYVLSIPHTCKKSILDELRLLNIARETLFPGLDETARSVIQRYSI